jgi:hypothetical protein
MWHIAQESDTRTIHFISHGLDDLLIFMELLLLDTRTRGCMHVLLDVTTAMNRFVC